MIEATANDVAVIEDIQAMYLADGWPEHAAEAGQWLTIAEQTTPQPGPGSTTGTWPPWDRSRHDGADRAATRPPGSRRPGYDRRSRRTRSTTSGRGPSRAPPPRRTAT